MALAPDLIRMFLLRSVFRRSIQLGFFCSELDLLRRDARRREHVRLIAAIVLAAALRAVIGRPCALAVIEIVPHLVPVAARRRL